MNEHRGLWRGKRKVYHNYETNEDVFEWVEGYYVCPLSEEHLIYNGCAVSDGDTFYPDCYPVDPSTLGRCSEIPDKNDKPIFEGDRVSVPMYTSTLNSKNNMTGTVIWEKGAFSVVWDNDLYGKHFLGHLEDVEVIGNIHDNPELLNTIGEDIGNAAQNTIAPAMEGR